MLRAITADGIAEADDAVRHLDRVGSPTGYVFRCLHCGQHLADIDCD